MQDIDFGRGVWAVISVPSHGLLIGSMDFWRDGLTADDLELLANALAKRGPVDINQCFGLRAEVVPVQGGVTFFRQCYPITGHMGPAKITTIIDGALLFSQMAEDDQKRHKHLVEQIAGQLAAARAQEAGISIAKPGDIPRGRILSP